MASGSNERLELRKVVSDIYPIRLVLRNCQAQPKVSFYKPPSSAPSSMLFAHLSIPHNSSTRLLPTSSSLSHRSNMKTAPIAHLPSEDPSFPNEERRTPTDPLYRALGPLLAIHIMAILVLLIIREANSFVSSFECSLYLKTRMCDADES